MINFTNKLPQNTKFCDSIRTYGPEFKSSTDSNGQQWTTTDKKGQQSVVLYASVMPFFDLYLKYSLL